VIQCQAWQTLGNFKLGVEFTAPLGLVVLFGPSGCGKSTILNILAGLLTPARGRVQVGSEQFLDTEQRVNWPPQKRQVGYVFQNHALFPHLTVHENIAFALHRWSISQQEQRVLELLTQLQLTGLERQCIQQLSGGQAQRVALARALAPYPRLLLLDEPFNALDSDLRETLGRELKHLQQQLQLPMVLVTHDRAEATRLADTVVLIAQGRVQLVGPPHSVLTTP